MPKSQGFLSHLNSLNLEAAEQGCKAFLSKLSQTKHSFSCKAEKPQNAFAEHDSAILDIYPEADDLAHDYKKFGGIFIRVWAFGLPRRFIYGLFLGAERAEQSEPRRGVAYARRRFGRVLTEFEKEQGLEYHTWGASNFPWVKQSSRSPARQLEQFISFKEEALTDQNEQAIVARLQYLVTFLDDQLRRIKPIRSFGQAIINEYYSENLPETQLGATEVSASDDELFRLVLARNNIILRNYALDKAPLNDYIISKKGGRSNAIYST